MAFLRNKEVPLLPVNSDFNIEISTQQGLTSPGDLAIYSVSIKHET